MRKIYMMVLTAITAVSLCGCGDMDETYKEFWQDGEIVYAGVVDSLTFHPGRNRAQISFKITDPSVDKVRIFWNNKQQNVETPVDPVNNQGPYVVDLPDMKESIYSFEAYSYNKKEDPSMAVSLVGRVYGSEYEKTLLITPMKTAEQDEQKPENFTITWGTPDATAIYSEVIYTDINDEVQTIEVPSSEKSTLIEGYKDGTGFSYRTVFMPDTLAIDKFYTAYKECVVRGTPKKIDRTGWTSTSTHDESKVRPATNAIDTNGSNEWVTSRNNTLPANEQYAIIDMKQKHRISGFYVKGRNNKDSMPKDGEFLVSNDGENWTSVLTFTLLKAAGEQLFDLEKDVEARYFKYVIKSSHDNKTMVAVLELGAYYR